jgi:hypothetical protein
MHLNLDLLFDEIQERDYNIESISESIRNDMSLLCELINDYRFLIDYERMFSSVNVADLTEEELQTHLDNYLPIMPSLTLGECKAQMQEIICLLIKNTLILAKLHGVSDFSRIIKLFSSYKINSYDGIPNFGILLKYFDLTSLDENRLKMFLNGQFNTDDSFLFIKDSLILLSDLQTNIDKYWNFYTEFGFYIGDDFS